MRQTKTCPICVKPANSPFRRKIEGVIVEGCISEFHTGHLPEESDTAEWHNREKAKAWREARKTAGYNY